MPDQTENMTHKRNCAALAWDGWDHGECTCGLQHRIALATEQTMHAAWRKRAEEAESELLTLKEKIVADKPVFTKLDPPETLRIYHFPGGETFRLDNVTALAVSASGTHRLETQDGKKWIVPTGWLAIELDMKDWTL